MKNKFNSYTYHTQPFKQLLKSFWTHNITLLKSDQNHVNITWASYKTHTHTIHNHLQTISNSFCFQIKPCKKPIKIMLTSHDNLIKKYTYYRQPFTNPFKITLNSIKTHVKIIAKSRKLYDNHWKILKIIAGSKENHKNHTKILRKS